MLQSKHRVSEWIRTQDPSICCLQEIHFRSKSHLQIESKGMESHYHANGHQKKAGVAVLLSDKLDFKIKNVTRDEEGHYVIIKKSIPPRRSNNYKYLCPQLVRTEIRKIIHHKHKETHC